jgi:hypothetical protein
MGVSCPGGYHQRGIGGQRQQHMEQPVLEHGLVDVPHPQSPGHDDVGDSKQT